MKVFGLTGGIGMGKSTAGRLLRERGLPVVDTDDLARKVVEPGQPSLDEIRGAFGASVIGPDGRLRRGELARIVFDDSTALKQLEGILHPRIRILWQSQVEAWRAEGYALGVVVIPLLFETGAAVSLDAVVCVACSTATQLTRLAERGWTREQVQKRLNAQWPIERKMEFANYVVWTEGGLAVLAEQLSRILAPFGPNPASAGQPHR